MEKYIVGVVLMDKNGKIYCWCYFDVKILTTFCIDFVLMIQNVRGKNCIGVVVWLWDHIAIQWLEGIFPVWLLSTTRSIVSEDGPVWTL